MPAANKQLIPLLILAHVCAQLVAVACSRNNGFRGSYDVYFLGILLAQIPLVALWFAWGNTRFFWRTVGTLAFIVASAVIHQFAFDRSDSWQLESFYASVRGNAGRIFLLASLVAAPLLMARALGVVVCHDADRNSFTPPPRSSPPWQFTLWNLLSLTTAVSVVLGISLSADYSWLGLDAVASFAVWGYGTAGCVLVLLVARTWRLGSLLLLLVVVAEFALFKPLTPDVYRYGMLDSPVVHGQLFAAIGTAWVVRLAGYRLSWPALAGRSQREPSLRLATATLAELR